MTRLDILGLVLSFAFVFAAIGAAGLIHRYRWLSPFTTRKIIHISVAHWWLMAMLVFSSVRTALVGPVFFILFNYISLRLHLVKAMEEDRDAGNWGTVLFPVSLLGMVLLCWGGWMPLWIGAAGILSLGWGDGLASLVGRRFGRRKLPVYDRRKSWAGSLSLFAATFAVILIVVSLSTQAALPAVLAVALVTALVAALVEILTPFNLDNLSLPFAVALTLRLAWAGGFL